MSRLSLPVLVAGLALAGCGSARDTSDATKYSADRVDREDFDGRSVARVEEMLRGRIAGVEVYTTAQGLVVRIRSAGTSGVGLSGDQPLFIVDGLPIALGVQGALVGINPKDVESIRVLKNASETAMYGSRGANGVVLITTIRPPARPAPDGPPAP